VRSDGTLFTTGTASMGAIGVGDTINRSSMVQAIGVKDCIGVGN
jgi:hypothetical protein